MHMPAFNMIRFDVGNFKPFFERILARHNQKMKAYVAVQKKLLVLIYTIWKKNEVLKTKTSWHKIHLEKRSWSLSSLSPEGLNK